MRGGVSCHKLLRFLSFARLSLVIHGVTGSCACPRLWLSPLLTAFRKWAFHPLDAMCFLSSSFVRVFFFCALCACCPKLWLRNKCRTVNVVNKLCCAVGSPSFGRYDVCGRRGKSEI